MTATDPRRVPGLDGIRGLAALYVPIAALVSHQVGAPGLPGFWVTLAVAVPACLVAAHVFAAAVER